MKVVKIIALAALSVCMFAAGAAAAQHEKKEDPSEAEKNIHRKWHLEETVPEKRHLETILIWDPLMKTDVPPVKPAAEQAVISPTAFRVSKEGVTLRKADFKEYVDAYKASGYAVWPLVDNNFDPEATHAFLSDEKAQEMAVKTLINYARRYGLEGYNLDFENINYTDRDRLTRFVERFGTAARENKLCLSMDVTPVSDSENWSKVYDRRSLAKHLDYVMLMAYDEVGRMSSAGGPTASYPWILRAVQLSLPLIGKEKLVLGMPLYMRIWYCSRDGTELPENPTDWPPVIMKTDAAGKKVPDMTVAVSGKWKARTLTLKDSAAIREQYKEFIRWDEKLHLSYLHLPLKTGTVKIWFEDEGTLREKLAVADLYHLKSVAFWRKGFEGEGFWQDFAAFESVEK